MLSDSLDLIESLVREDLPRSLMCSGASLLLVETKLLKTTAPLEASTNHLHASRTKDDSLGAMCLRSKTFLGCKHGTLHNHLPSVFFGIYDPNSEDAMDEEGPWGLVLKLCFDNAHHYDAFLESGKDVDVLLRYFDRAADACKCIKHWLLSHNIELKFKADRKIEASTRSENEECIDKSHFIYTGILHRVHRFCLRRLPPLLQPLPR